MQTHFFILPCLALVLSLITQTSYSQDYQLVWSDEFTTTIGPDWTAETGNNNGWGNSELQYYQAKNLTIENENLVITAKKEWVGGSQYTSGRMKTQGKKSFQYGKIEARIKMPAQMGLWAAFWMLGDNISTVGWPSCGEIDIMEQINTNMRILGTCHWSNNGQHAHYGKEANITVTDYNIYSIEWDEQFIKWYINGINFNTIAITTLPAFTKPHFILLNMAIGGTLPGNTITSALPAKMYVDYVRVYQKQKTCAATTIPAQIEAESYCNMLGINTETTTDAGGGSNVGWFEAGDWLNYTINVPTTGKYTVKYRLATLNTSKTLYLEEMSGATHYGTVDVPATGGWQTWQTVSQDIQLTAGTHTLKLGTTTGGFNINWFDIASTPTAMNEVAENAMITVFPNPTTNSVTINTKKTTQTIAIYNMNGQQIYFQANPLTTTTVNCDTYPTGLYFIVIKDAENTIYTDKFQKK